MNTGRGFRSLLICSLMDGERIFYFIFFTCALVSKPLFNTVTVLNINDPGLFITIKLFTLINY